MRLNKKGLFSYILFFIIIIMIINQLIIFQQINEKNNLMQNTLSINEIINCKRTILEEKIDNVIYQELQKEFIKQYFDSDTIKENINQNLEKIFLKENLILENQLKNEINLPTKENLNKVTKVSITHLEKVTIIDYIFTSNFEKTIKLTKKIGDKMNTYFEIPIDYKISYVGLKVV
ncbi:MAG: hypothetical protein PHQ98_00675 [Candidatus ainarchaeum sp.]|nr:hypothetical protein [Candidatus ainarchaeum sp.]